MSERVGSSTAGRNERHLVLSIITQHEWVEDEGGGGCRQAVLARRL